MPQVGFEPTIAVFKRVKTVHTVTNLLKALRNSGHVATQQVTSYNNRASVYNTLLSSRQQTNEMPG
jgi:hypothetical protein